jgi:SAM-dependent methyltransferase
VVEPRRDTVPPPLERFRGADAYRVRREWLRYEGTAQRDLFRELRQRFLLRHAAENGWVLDIGSGPGRFLPFVGRAGVRRVALDVSVGMLQLVPGTWNSVGIPGPLPDRVLGNGTYPPFEPGRWAEVVLLGNALGFAGEEADRLLEEAERLVAPGGVLLVEVAPGPGERSRYLARLPPSAVARLLRSPVRAVLGRLDREGFRDEPPRHRTPRTFRRFSASELHERWRARGWEVGESVAVAPVLGPDVERIDAVRNDPTAWSRLLELEEEVGRRLERWPTAAAVLVAARHPLSMRMIK